MVRAYSRASKMYIIKNRNVYDVLSFKKTILLDVESHVESRNIMTYDLGLYIRKTVPKTFHGMPLPDKDTMIAQKKS